MKIAPVADVKARFSAYLKESEESPVIVIRNGKPLAVLISMEDEEELERIILAYSPKFRSLLEKSKTQIQDRGGISHQDFWKEVTGQI
jgi:prevent-host-death family protein